MIKSTGALCGLSYVIVMASIPRPYLKERKLLMRGHAAEATIVAE
ncbi:MAG: hypothetical protein ACREC9_01970 [Methylocella sp.]